MDTGSKKQREVADCWVDRSNVAGNVSVAKPTFMWTGCWALTELIAEASNPWATF